MPENNTAPAFSVVVPLYNTQAYIAEALDSVLAQTFADFEIVVVNDASTDNGPAIVEDYRSRDPRIRIVTQENRGLAGARNTGIREARGRYIALLDADDAFAPEKLQNHFEHLECKPDIGVSYAASEFMDENSRPMGIAQTPKLVDIDADHIFCRNPVGNGSAAVLRRSCLDDVAFQIDAQEGPRTCWFDETFRQSEDVEMWTRMAATTSWRFEGIPGTLTLYRVNTGGLSANVDKQFATWQRLRDKLKTIAPDLVARSGARAECYQLRYLARRAAISGDGQTSMKLLGKALKRYPRILIEEAPRTLLTAGFAVLATLLPTAAFERLKTMLFKPRRPTSGQQGAAREAADRDASVRGQPAAA